MKLGGLSFESFEVDHFPVVPAFGYRATFDSRTAVLSGDTSFCESLATASQGADMLVCEALNQPMMTNRIAALKAGGRERDAGMMSDMPCVPHSRPAMWRSWREQAGVGELVLSHLIPPLPTTALQRPHSWPA